MMENVDYKLLDGQWYTQFKPLSANGKAPPSCNHLSLSFNTDGTFLGSGEMLVNGLHVVEKDISGGVLKNIILDTDYKNYLIFY